MGEKIIFSIFYFFTHPTLVREYFNNFHPPMYVDPKGRGTSCITLLGTLRYLVELIS